MGTPSREILLKDVYDMILLLALDEYVDEVHTEDTPLCDKVENYLIPGVGEDAEELFSSIDVLLEIGILEPDCIFEDQYEFSEVGRKVAICIENIVKTKLGEVALPILLKSYNIFVQNEETIMKHFKEGISLYLEHLK